MKQTAVEQLVQEIKLNSKLKENSKGGISFKIGLSKIDELLNQAKAMEHEQMEFFYKQGHLNSGCPYALEEVYLKRFEDESND